MCDVCRVLRKLVQFRCSRDRLRLLHDLADLLAGEGVVPAVDGLSSPPSALAEARHGGVDLRLAVLVAILIAASLAVPMHGGLEALAVVRDRVLCLDLGLGHREELDSLAGFEPEGAWLASGAH